MTPLGVTPACTGHSQASSLCFPQHRWAQQAGLGRHCGIILSPPRLTRARAISSGLSNAPHGPGWQLSSLPIAPSTGSLLLTAGCALPKPCPRNRSLSIVLETVGGAQMPPTLQQTLSSRSSQPRPAAPALSLQNAFPAQINSKLPICSGQQEEDPDACGVLTLPCQSLPYPSRSLSAAITKTSLFLLLEPAHSSSQSCCRSKSSQKRRDTFPAPCSGGCSSHAAPGEPSPSAPL